MLGQDMKDRGGYTSVVERILSMHEVPGSLPSISFKKNKNKQMTGKKRSQPQRHLGESIPDSTANVKALRQELAEPVLRSTRRPVWPEGSEGRECKGVEVRERARWEVLSLRSSG